MKLSRYEQETVITYNEEEKTAGVYTHNKALLRRLDKLAQERPDECRLEKARPDGRSADYIIPKAWVRIRPPRRMSPEQKARCAERLANARAPYIQADKSHNPSSEGNYTTQGI